MKKYNFDGHKLIYHLDRVNEYQNRGDCYPLYMEISPVGSCNHRCVFCAYDYLGYPNRKLETARVFTLLDELASCGLRSLLFAGEGEPLLHPEIGPIIRHAKTNGIDVGLFTNGQLLKEELAAEILPHLTFMRLSFNGGDRENYAAIHQVRPEVFDTVTRNIAAATRIKREQQLAADVGAQYVLIPENRAFLLSAVTTLKECGVDYLAIKPFMQRESQAYQLQEQYTLNAVDQLFAQAESHASASFAVMARKETFEDYGQRNYARCLGTPFIAVLNSAGIISSCLPYWERQEFAFGSIYEKSFSEIWNSSERRSIKAHLEQTLDAHACPPNCRPHAINEFLWDLKNPLVKHLNFI